MSGIIVDIDGTLLAGNNGIKHTIDYVNGQAGRYDIFVVTGRPESDRKVTEKALKANGVKYNRLFMKATSSVDSMEHKRDSAQKLMAKQRIVLAIDNDAKARGVYKSLGIKTESPSSLPTG
jgi:ribonucleotide monophosphatase NagD (HAD superfamily)